MAQKTIMNAEFVAVRRAQFCYGRDATPHFILRIGVKNPATGATHYADLPLIYTPGADWAFYDKTSGTSKARKTVVADTADAIARARRIFPQWAAYVDSLNEDAPPSEAFRWFDDNAGKGVTVSASFSERGYTSADGEAKTALEAQLYEQFEEALPGDFDERFAKVLKASSVRLGFGAKSGGGKVGAAAGAGGAAAVSPRVDAPAPQVGGAPGAQGGGAGSPSASGGGAPKPPRIVAHAGADGKEDAWRAYSEGGCLARDSEGKLFWHEVARITERPAKDWVRFTAEDWQKCIDVFLMPF